MEVKVICNHKKQRKYSNFSFCLKCGCIIIGKNISIKSIKYKYPVEQNPLLLFKTMRNSLVLKNRICQKFLLNRADLIKNMKVICRKFRFREQSFYLGTHYLDIILSNNTSSDVRMELVALCCLILASKFDEIDPVVPSLPNFETEYDNFEFPTEEIKKYEIFCIKSLNYKLNYYTASHFLDFFIVHGYIFSDEFLTPTSKYIPKTSRLPDNNDQLVSISENIYNNAKEVLSYFIDENSVLNFSPLQMACSCVTISREVSKLKEGWSSNLEKMYGIKLDDFQSCMNTIIQLLISNIRKIHLKISNNLDLSTYLFNKKNCTTPKPSAIKTAILTYKTIKSNKLTISLGSDELNKLTLNDKKEDCIKKYIKHIHSPLSQANQQSGNKTSRIYKKGDSGLNINREEFLLEKNKINPSKNNSNLFNTNNPVKSCPINELSTNNKSKFDHTFGNEEIDHFRLTSRATNRKRSLHINLALNPIHSISDEEKLDKQLIVPSKIRATIMKANQRFKNNSITTNPINSNNIKNKVKEYINIQKLTSYTKELVLPEESSNIKENLKNYNANNTIKYGSNTAVKTMASKGNNNYEMRSDFKPKLKNIYPNTNLTGSIGIIIKKLNNKGEKK